MQLDQDILEAAQRVQLTRGTSTSTVVGDAWKPLDPSFLCTAPPARRWLLRHPTRNGATCAPGEGDGLLPLGKLGMLVADGGIGKTMVLVTLAVCTITGRPWLGHFHVGHDARGQHVLLVLAEEDLDEVHRRIFPVAEGLNLSVSERDLIADRLVVLGLAGRPAAFVAPTAERRISETAELVELRRRLALDPDRKWSLVGVDPLARFGEGEIESSNDSATRAVQALESLTATPGGPTVLVAHHSSKLAVRSGTADARGVTALRDGVRWEASLTPEGGDVLFQQTKSNYSRPMADALRLVRGPEGLLRVASASDEAEREERARERREVALGENVERVVDALRRNGGRATSKNQIATLAGMKVQAGRIAVDDAIARGKILRTGTQRDPAFILAAS